MSDGEGSILSETEPILEQNFEQALLAPQNSIVHPTFSAPDLAILLDDDAFSDVTFLVGPDRVPIKAHKNILYCRSEYFKKMFGPSFVESKSTEIEMMEVSPEIFRLVLRFLYTGKMDIDFDIVFPIFVFADEIDCQDMKEYCSKFICKQASDVFSSPMFLNVPEGLLAGVLESDQLNMNELDVFLAVKRWGEATQPTAEETAARRAATLRLMDNIRFLAMNPEDLIQTVEPSGLVPREVLYDTFRILVSPNLLAEVRSKEPKKVSSRGGQVASLEFETNLPEHVEAHGPKCVIKGDQTGHVVVLAKNPLVKTDVSKWRVKVGGLVPLGSKGQWVSFGVAMRGVSRTHHADVKHWCFTSYGQSYSASSTDGSKGFEIPVGEDELEVSYSPSTHKLKLVNFATAQSCEMDVTAPPHQDLFPSFGLYCPGNKITLL